MEEVKSLERKCLKYNIDKGSPNVFITGLTAGEISETELNIKP